MTFTGKNLALVRRALDLALGEIHNQVATCPNVIEFADDLDELDIEKAKIQRLIDRIDRKTA
jgi:hypothetical protein